MNARDYQEKARCRIREEFVEARSTLVSMPTGTGKTVVAGLVIKDRFPGRTLFIAHREELVFQAQRSIARVAGLRTEIEMGDLRVQRNGLFEMPHVVVATVQTLTSGGDGGGRIGKFSPEDFDTIIADECHHAVSPSWRRVINYFLQNPKARVCGFTATADRSDEQALGQVFDTVAFDYEILDAIHDGWLVPITQQMVNVQGLDFSQVRTTAGDLNGADLAAVMEAERNMHEMSGPSIDIIGNRRALVFTASVKQAQTLAEIFNRHRAGMASWVCGKTDKDERRKILADFSAGKIQVVCNCGVLTEGFDDPGVEVIIMGRPTKSRSLYSQMVGRSTRPLPGVVDGPETAELRCAAIAASAKPSCLVVDFVGNSGKHKLMTSADILGGNVSDEVLERAIRHTRENGKPVRMDELIEEEEKQMREERRLEEEARRARLVAKAKYTTQAVDPFDVLQIRPVASRGWDSGKTLTEKQRGLLTRAGVDPDSLPYPQAKQLIGELIHRFEGHLCTLKQAAWLRKHGYSASMSMEEASRTMDAWAKNGWKRPVVQRTAPPPFRVPEPADIPF